MDLSSIKEQLSTALQAAGLEILGSDGKYIDLAHTYRIEIENETLFKLLHEGMVIAPFDSLSELCEFIRMDIALNYG